MISRVQHDIIAWRRAVSCHLQPRLFVSSRAVRCLGTSGI